MINGILIIIIIINMGIYRGRIYHVLRASLAYSKDNLYRRYLKSWKRAKWAHSLKSVQKMHYYAMIGRIFWSLGHMRAKTVVDYTVARGDKNMRVNSDFFIRLKYIPVSPFTYIFLDKLPFLITKIINSLFFDNLC